MMVDGSTSWSKEWASWKVVHVLVVEGRRVMHVAVVEVGVEWLDAVMLGVVVVAVVANVVVDGATSWTKWWSRTAWRTPW